MTLGKDVFYPHRSSIKDSYSLPPGVRGWLRLLLVTLPGLFCLPFFLWCLCRFKAINDGNYTNTILDVEEYCVILGNEVGYQCSHVCQIKVHKHKTRTDIYEKLTPSLGETHAVPHNRLPQARLSDFDETWHKCSPYSPSARNGVFFKFGLLLPVLERHLLPKLHSTVSKANYYVISGNLICLLFQKHIIKDTFVVYYLKVLPFLLFIIFVI